MKHLRSIFAVLIVLISCSCSNEEDYLDELRGTWIQSYNGKEEVQPPYDKKTLIIESNNSGRVINEIVKGLNWNDTVRIDTIKDIVYYEINKLKHFSMIFKDDSRLTYEIHQIRPKYLYVIEHSELYTFLKK
jgi:hypothetical protein